MMDYQRALFPGVAYGGMSTFGALRLEFWRHWTDGNWHTSVRHMNLLTEKLEERITKMSDKRSDNAPNAPFFFINVPVSDADLDAIDELFPVPDVAFNLLASVIAEGFKVSFALNHSNQLTICSLFDRRDGSTTLGGCLTGGGDGWYESLCVCLYKYTALLHGDLEEGRKTTGDNRRIM